MFKTVAVVTTFSVGERFLGFLYRIFLSRTLGAQGLGIYQIALSVFGVLVTVTASGIPVTVSRMIIKHKTENNKKGVYQTVSAGVVTALLFSVPVTVLFFLFKGKISFLFSDKRCVTVLAIIIPSLAINSVYAVIRGAFWGNKNFFAYSLIEFLEEFVMIASGIISIGLSSTLMQGVKSASYSVLISYIFSFILSTIVMLAMKNKPANPLPQLKPLLASATPVTAMRTTTSLINSLIAIILPARLIASGLSSTQAVAYFGEVSGMAIPMLFIPSSLIGSIALVLVPELSENFYKKDYNELSDNVCKALKYSVMIACFIIPVFFSCGTLIGKTVYSNENAGNYLTNSAFMMLPMSVSMITTSVLNSLNAEKKTLLYYLLGEAGLIASIYFLPKFLGAGSLIVGYYFSFTLSGTLNLILLEKKCKKKIYYKKFLLFAFLFTLPSSVLGIFIKNILLNFLNEILALIISATAVTVFNLLFYVVFGIINVKKLFKIGNSNQKTAQKAT